MLIRALTSHLRRRCLAHVYTELFDAAMEIPITTTNWMMKNPDLYSSVLWHACGRPSERCAFYKISEPTGSEKRYWSDTEMSLECLFIYLFSPALQSSAGYGLLVSRGFLITHNDAPQSVGLLWTGDQLVAETSTWQHTTHTTDKHPCLRWDSNPRSQQVSGRRLTL
jgi:hypothetical protein